jgi:pimeloyl-ACP methyl ester carboxylesterase
LSIQVSIPLLGDLLVDGEIAQDQPSVAYIHEFCGESLPPEQFRSFVNCSFILPGYGEAVLAEECEGNQLTWERYGKAVAETIERIHQPFTLVGNSMGAMVAIYAAAQTSLINQLVLYRIPRFGETRLKLNEKYRGISHSITDEDTYVQFLKTIHENTSPSALNVLERTRWDIAKKLYEGASLSDFNPSVLMQLTQSVTLLEHEFEGDYLHPKEAHDALQSLLLTKH